MAHYAFLDDSNIVTEVIVGVDENELIEGLSPEEWYGNFKGQKCVRTSYSGSIRYNFAGIGFIYDPIDDAFIQPQPYPSWILSDVKKWQPPVAKPNDDKSYFWNEETQSWDEMA
jgi:hypothetical protein